MEVIQIAENIWNKTVKLELQHNTIEKRFEFDDIAVYFSEEEWDCLLEEERTLYKIVMMENYQTLRSLGHIKVKPALVSKIERGEEPCVTSHSHPEETENPVNTIIGKMLGQRFSPAENEALIFSLEQNYPALFGDLRRATSAELRESLWLTITAAVNAVSTTGRTEAQCKKRVSDIKTKVIRKVALLGARPGARRGRGGGRGRPRVAPVFQSYERAFIRLLGLDIPSLQDGRSAFLFRRRKPSPADPDRAGDSSTDETNVSAEPSPGSNLVSTSESCFSPEREEHEDAIDDAVHVQYLSDEPQPLPLTTAPATALSAPLAPASAAPVVTASRVFPSTVPVATTSISKVSSASASVGQAPRHPPAAFGSSAQDSVQPQYLSDEPPPPPMAALSIPQAPPVTVPLATTSVAAVSVGQASTVPTPQNPSLSYGASVQATDTTAQILSRLDTLIAVQMGIRDGINNMRGEVIGMQETINQEIQQLGRAVRIQGRAQLALAHQMMDFMANFPQEFQTSQEDPHRPRLGGGRSRRPRLRRGIRRGNSF
ncbi:myb-related transcription factor, partner of profilin-like [Bombina bombina]|uniref:myb-related transcription factor, partner of profilin-like n=1 Tax=Bombina bombina TaxID=8345 RepID=UPI00235AA173|nr:myb-related transcription factor, partner of profilin-like [Bombina bombina]